MKKSEGSRYTDSVNTRFPIEVSKAIKSYCEEESIKPPVLVRKAVVKYLKDKDVLKKDKKYL